MKIVGNAEEIVRTFENIALPKSSDVLFNPLRLVVGADGKVTVAVKNEGNTAFAQATLNLKAEGTSDVTVDTQQLLKFLRVYNSKEEITIDVSEEITISGAKKQSTLYPEALTAIVPDKLPRVKEGVVYYKGGELPVTTVVTLEAEELSALLTDAKLLDAKTFTLSFGEDGSFARLGGTEAKENKIQTNLNATVKGPRVTLTVGSDLTHLLTNLTGALQLQLMEGFPLAIVKEDTTGSYLYVLSDRR